MSLKKDKIQVLNVLYQNLQKTQPLLVPSKRIAVELNMQMVELRNVLKSMEGAGMIETDPDQRFNLITRKGLLWLDQQSVHLDTYS